MKKETFPFAQPRLAHPSHGRQGTVQRQGTNKVAAHPKIKLLKTDVN